MESLSDDGASAMRAFASLTRLTGTSWDETWGVMMRAVNRGLARKEQRVPARIGIDGKSVGTGHNYESILCDLDKSALLRG